MPPGKFDGDLFGWSFPEGGMPGYSYVETGVEGAIPGGISPLQDGQPFVTFFVGGVADVAGTLDNDGQERRSYRSAGDRLSGSHFRTVRRPARPRGRTSLLQRAERRPDRPIESARLTIRTSR